MFKITILKLEKEHKRTKLLHVLRNELLSKSAPDFRLLKLNEIINNLPNSPFIIYSLHSRDEIELALKKACIYLLEEVPPEQEEAIPPSQNPRYLIAKSWYDKLSRINKERIKLLIRANSLD